MLPGLQVAYLLASLPHRPITATGSIGLPRICCCLLARHVIADLLLNNGCTLIHRSHPAHLLGASLAVRVVAVVELLAGSRVLGKLLLVSQQALVSCLSSKLCRRRLAS